MACVNLHLTGPEFKLHQASRVSDLSRVIKCRKLFFQGARVLEAVTIRFTWPMVHLRTKYGEGAMSRNVTLYHENFTSLSLTILPGQLFVYTAHFDL